MCTVKPVNDPLMQNHSMWLCKNFSQHSQPRIQNIYTIAPKPCPAKVDRAPDSLSSASSKSTMSSLVDASKVPVVRVGVTRVVIVLTCFYQKRNERMFEPCIPVHNSTCLRVFFCSRQYKSLSKPEPCTLLKCSLHAEPTSMYDACGANVAIGLQHCLSTCCACFS